MKKMYLLPGLILATALFTTSCNNKEKELQAQLNELRQEINNRNSQQDASSETAAADATPQNYGKNELREAARNAQEAPMQVSTGQTWYGTIRGAGGITMYIDNETGEFWYYYNKFGKKLYLTVMSSSGNYLELYEQNDRGEITGTFSGTLTNNSYSGTFTNYKGRTFPFSLHR